LDGQSSNAIDDDFILLADFLTQAINSPLLVTSRNKSLASDLVGESKNTIIVDAMELQRQGKYDEAKTINQRALEGREKELGLTHPDMLTSIYCLAYLFHSQERYDNASRLYERANTGYQNSLGVIFANSKQNT
jgi:tetratricopeptide (TPR) repeat protein